MAMDTFKKSIGNWNASISDIVEGLDSQGMETVSDEELDTKSENVETEEQELEKELEAELDGDLDEDLEEELEKELDEEVKPEEEMETETEVEPKEEMETETELKEEEVETELETEIETESETEVETEHEETEVKEEEEGEVKQEEPSDYKNLGYGLETVEDLDQEETEDKVGKEEVIMKDMKEKQEVIETVNEEVIKAKSIVNDNVIEINLDTNMLDNNDIQIMTFNPPTSLESIIGICNFNPETFRSKDIRETDLNDNITKVENCDVITLGEDKLLLSKSFYDKNTVMEYFNDIANTLKLGRNYVCNLIDVNEGGMLSSKLSALELFSLNKSFEKVLYKVYVAYNSEQDEYKLCLSVKLA